MSKKSCDFPRVAVAVASLATLAVLLASCVSEEVRGPVVARVDGADLTRASLEDQMPLGLDPETAAVERRAFVENWVHQELLYQEALATGVGEGARIQRLLAQARRDLLIAAFLNREFENQQVGVTDEAIEDYYHLHADRFLRPTAEVRAQHILVGSRRDANALRQKLIQGDSFMEAARQHSLDEDTKMTGGSLGFFAAEDDPVLWELCRDLVVNRISDPLPTELGYHLVRVLDRKEPGTVKEVEQVRGEIVEALVREEHERRLDELIDRLKEKRSWEIDEAQLAAQ